MSSRPTVVILDYGSGNLRSAQRALTRIGADVTVSSDVQAATDAQGLVIPGVGAFGSCMRGLQAVRAQQIVDRRLAGGRAVLGVCVGMQVLFAQGQEGSLVAGLDQWPGTVRRLQAKVLPHMGWNQVRTDPQSDLFRGLAGERFYFVHSYAVTQWQMEVQPPRPPVRLAWSWHGEEFLAAVENGPLTATQFHPEKSGDAGLGLLRNWLDTLT